MRTDQFIVQPGYDSGAARTVDLLGLFDSSYKGTSLHVADADAVAADWAVVGDTIKKEMIILARDVPSGTVRANRLKALADDVAESYYGNAYIPSHGITPDSYGAVVMMGLFVATMFSLFAINEMGWGIGVVFVLDIAIVIVYEWSIYGLRHRIRERRPWINGDENTLSNHRGKRSVRR